MSSWAGDRTSLRRASAIRAGVPSSVQRSLEPRESGEDAGVGRGEALRPLCMLPAPDNGAESARQADAQQARKQLRTPEVGSLQASPASHMCPGLKWSAAC